jgi:hypothetical protein
LRGRRGAGVRTSPPGTKWGYYYFLILLDRNVQKEVALTGAQLDNFEVLKGDFLDHLARRTDTQAAKDREKPRRKDRGTSAGEKDASASRIALLSNKAVALLTDRQKIRLGQIIFQLRKVEAFYYPEVAKFLELSDEQTKEVAAIRRRTADDAKKLRAQFAQKRKTSRDVQKGTVALLEEGCTRLLKTFDAEQVRKLESLEGKKISFDQTDLNFEVHRSNRAKAAAGVERRE